MDPNSVVMSDGHDPRQLAEGGASYQGSPPGGGYDPHHHAAANYYGKQQQHYPSSAAPPYATTNTGNGGGTIPISPHHGPAPVGPPAGGWTIQQQAAPNSPSMSPYGMPPQMNMSNGQQQRTSVTNAPMSPTHGPAGYPPGQRVMSVSVNSSAPRASVQSPTSPYGEYAAPLSVKVHRPGTDRVRSADATMSQASTRSSLAGFRGSTSSREGAPLLGKDKATAREKQAGRLMFVWLGASTLVLQTIIFITMEDVQNKFFPDFRYTFFAHNIFASSFFIGTAVFACFPARLLFSLRLLSFLNFIAIILAIAFPSVVLIGKGQSWAFVTACVLVALITALCVLLIPVVFTSATAVPGECAMYAAFGQGLGAVLTALVAVVLVLFLSPKRFLFACAFLATAVHAAAIVSLQRLRSYTWASRRLQRLSDAHAPKKTESGSRRESRRAQARRFIPACSGVMKIVFPQIACAFLSTFVSFCVFPAFSTRLGHSTSRGFGVAMVAIFHGCDQLGRHIPELGLGLPPPLLLILVLVRFGFLPLYVAMFNQSFTASVIGVVLLNSFVQSLMGFTHGWAVASAFRYIPAVLTKYEVERVQFYLSFSNALGIPFGALLMSGLVMSGYFPQL